MDPSDTTAQIQAPVYVACAEHIVERISEHDDLTNFLVRPSLTTSASRRFGYLTLVDSP
jgi:hypothetical protein